jgi:predicted O-methyltransferase YrrM
VEPNVILHVGVFQETLQPFLNEKEGTVAFAHIDSDLYSSAKFVLESISDRIREGTIIVFDEYLFQEQKAFNDFIYYAGIEYRYLSYHLHEQDRINYHPHSVALVIEKC